MLHVSDCSAPPPASRAIESRDGSGPVKVSSGNISMNLTSHRVRKSRSRVKHFSSMALETATAVPPAEQ